MKQLLLFIVLLVFPFFLFSSGEKKVSYNFSTGFVENKGQVLDQNNSPNRNVRYMLNSESSGIQVQLRGSGFSYQVGSKFDSLKQGDAYSFGSQRIDIEFENPLQGIEIVPGESFTGNFNYYTQGTEGVTGVKHYREIIYKQVWQGVDVIFKVDQKTKKAEYDFVLQPGAKLEDIKLKINGSANITEKDGCLLVATEYGIISEQIPLSYQEKEGTRIKRNVKWKKINNETWGFKGTWDIGAALVIDPAPSLIWGTYIGGASVSGERGNAISADNIGNVYVAGYIRINGNVATAGAYQTVFGGGGGADGFLAKFDSSGALLWGTYFGKTGSEICHGVCTDDGGNVYITGSTTSAGMAFGGAPHQPASGGGQDAFIAKFNSSGAIQWCTYYGGVNSDIGNAIVTDGNAFLYVAGDTDSPGMATSGAFKTTYTDGDSPDAFLVKFNLSGVLQWGTYFGGSISDDGRGVAIDAADNVYLMGAAASSDGIATAGAYQTKASSSSDWDAYIAKFNPMGALLWGTYYGGPGHEIGSLGGNIIVDNNNVYIAGNTESATGIATSGTWKTFLDGIGDAFLAKFDSAGVFQWGTYYGGSANENYAYLTSDGNNNIYLTGQTQSNSGGGIATVDAYQTAHGEGLNDAFIAKFDANGMLQYGTYYGGSGGDAGNAIASDGCSSVYVTGNASSGLPVPGGYQTTYGGGVSDIFVARFGNMLSITTPAITASGTTTFCQGGSVTLDAGSAYTSYLWSPGEATTQSISSIASDSYTVSVTKACAVGTATATMIVVVNALPTVLPSSSEISICAGATSLSLSVSAADNYYWFPASGLDATSGPSVLCSLPTIANIYTYTIIGSNLNNCADTTTIEITVNALPTADISGSITICEGLTTVLTATGGIGYSWKPPTYLDATNTANVIVSPLESGSYEYEVSITGINDCSSIATTTVTVLPGIIANAGMDVSICSGNSSSLSAAGGGTLYLWNPASNLNNANINNPIATPLVTTTYTLVTFNGTCGDTANVTITVTSTPTVTASAGGSICSGESLTLTASATSPLTWSTGSTETAITVLPFITTTYTVSAINGECLAQKQIIVNVTTTPTATIAGPAILCKGDQETLTVTGGVTYLWNTGDNTSSVNIGTLNDTTYSVIAYIGSCTDTAALFITVVPGIIVIAGPDTVIDIGNSIDLSASSGAVSYSWTPNYRISCSDCQSTTVSPLRTTKYILTADAANGCESSYSITVYVEGMCPEPFVPNAFSPNNDGQNDFVGVHSCCIDTTKNFSFRIYNRWGEMVFETYRLAGSWDGSHEGEQLPSAVFVYSLDAVMLITGEVITKKGNISLMR